MAPLCKFFAKGECKFGDRCKYEHPRGPQNNNRFSLLQNEHNTTNSGRPYNDGRSSPPPDPTLGIKRETIIVDLSTEHPQWILSAYAPAPRAAVQLFGGPLREQSFEEMRMHYYNGIINGALATTTQQADALIREAEAQMRNALNDVDGAIDFIRRAQNEHPNRLDICQSFMKNSSQLLLGQSSVTATPATPAQVSFAMDNGPSQQGGGFGQPSLLGPKSNPFNIQSTFGQPTRLGSAGAFGQPSVLGQKPNPFGTLPGSATSRGPAPFSSFAAASNPFGGPPQPVGSSPFSQQSQPAQSGPFSQVASATGPSLFAQTGQSSFNQAVTSSNQDLFGRQGQANPFGPAPTDTEPSNPDPFNRTGSASLPFNPNPFGQPISAPATSHSNQTPGIQNTQTVNAPEQPKSVANGLSINGPYPPNARLKHPPLQSYSSQDAGRRLTMFKGKPVVYKDGEAGMRNRDGSWEKIWFPDGPPVHYKETEMNDDAYTEDIKTAYLHLRETGEFLGGIMPIIPPKREWCLWDF